MSNWKVIPTIVLATVLIFGAGVFTGGFLVNSVKPARPKKNIPHVELASTNSAANVVVVAPTNTTGQPVSKSPRPPEILSKEFLQRLDLELKLSPEQHEAVQKIISEGQSQMKKTMNAARLEIREVLTPEQQKQFDGLVRRPLRKPGSGTNAPVLPAAGVLPAAPTNAP